MDGWCSVEELTKWGFTCSSVAMEALPWPATDSPGPIRDIPAGAQGYLAQLDMRRLMSAALELGWSLWAYVIDQTVTVDFTGAGPQPWVRELLTAMGGTLTAHHGTAGILCDQAPPPLDGWPGVDAVVVSTGNALS